MLSIVNAYSGIIMATSTGSNIPLMKTLNINPLGFILNMAADLWLTLGFAILSTAFIYLPPIATLSTGFIYLPPFSGTIIRQALGIAMVLFVPGYALIAALFPGKKSMGGIERTVLSFGLSIAVVPLIGLLLNFTPWGIRLEPMLACVVIFTIACTLVANKRRLDIPKEERFSAGFSEIPGFINGEMLMDKTKLDRLLTVVTIVVLLLSIFTIAYFVMMPDKGEEYTEFYILGPDGMADNYSYKYVLGDEKTVIVGIMNHEQRNMTYDLAVSLYNQNNSTTEKLYSEQMALSDGDEWEKAVNVTPAMTGINMKMEFLLYANGNMSAPYKECYLWVNVTNPTPKPSMRPTATPIIRPCPTPVMNRFTNTPIEYTGAVFAGNS